MAMDEHGACSEWSDPLSVAMPKTDQLNMWGIGILGKLNRWFVSVLEKELLPEIFNL